MKQATFTDLEYGLRKKKTKREAFLETMDKSIPWDNWVSLIEPYYPKGERGRPPMGIEKMLRMYLLQCWFTLSDEGIEDAIYDSFAMRSFMKINFVHEQVPDATTLLHFRHLLEKNEINKDMFYAISKCFEESGYLIRGGTIVDATLINAASSTKNAKKERDPEMHSTKKGGQYFFGLKCHIGVDAVSGYVHTIKTTSANVHDIVATHELIREDDTVVYGDSGYVGIEKREEIINNPHLSSINYRINRRFHSVQKIPAPYPNWEKNIEKRKSSVRSKVEHPFLIVKRFFGYNKAIYKGLMKNTNRLYMLFASANLLMLARSGRMRNIASS